MVERAIRRRRGQFCSFWCGFIRWDGIFIQTGRDTVLAKIESTATGGQSNVTFSDAVTESPIGEKWTDEGRGCGWRPSRTQQAIMQCGAIHGARVGCVPFESPYGGRLEVVDSGSCPDQSDTRVQSI